MEAPQSSLNENVILIFGIKKIVVLSSLRYSNLLNLIEPNFDVLEQFPE